MNIPLEMGAVEFVATAPELLGKGIASAILSHIHQTEPYRQFILEVADSNTGAVKLYEKLGYRELKRVPQAQAKRSGINSLIYMLLDKDLRSAF